MQIASPAERLTIYKETNIPNILTVNSLINNSDDRLNENDEFIENVCETLSKVRPQLLQKARHWK